MIILILVKDFAPKIGIPKPIIAGLFFLIVFFALLFSFPGRKKEQSIFS
jgi:hypothetical protein